MNAHAYSHAICCMPTALPGPLYAAGELAKRGRNNYKMHKDTADGNNNQGGPSEDMQEGEQGDQAAEYCRQMTVQLKPGIPTKFWA